MIKPLYCYSVAVFLYCNMNFKYFFRDWEGEIVILIGHK